MEKNNASLLLLISLFLASGCAVQMSAPDLSASSSSSASTGEPAARIIFHKANFTWLDTFNPGPAYANSVPTTTQFHCPGDALFVYNITGGDYANSGTQSVFPTQTVVDDLSPTTKPVFLKNVSVDMTNTYYPNSQLSMIQSDSCSYRGIASASLPSYCADFDREDTTVTAPTPPPNPLLTTTPTPAPTPDYSANNALRPFFNTGYYRVHDAWCAYQGPVINNDVEVTKAHIGGVNIDLDRTQLGSNEDVLLNITYQAFTGEAIVNEWPIATAAPTGVFSSADHTILNVQMIGTNQSLDTMLGIKQPRAWAYYNTSDFPVYAQDIATLDDPFGGLRTEQVYVPLSKFPLVDRVRIERVRGTYILYEVDVYRLGERSVSAQ